MSKKISGRKHVETKFFYFFKVSQEAASISNTLFIMVDTVFNKYKFEILLIILFFGSEATF